MSKIKQLREDIYTANEDYKDGDYYLAFVEMERVANTAIRTLEHILKVLDKVWINPEKVVAITKYHSHDSQSFIHANNNEFCVDVPVEDAVSIINSYLEKEN